MNNSHAIEILKKAGEEALSSMKYWEKEAQRSKQSAYSDLQKAVDYEKKLLEIDISLKRLGFTKEVEKS